MSESSQPATETEVEHQFDDLEVDAPRVGIVMGSKSDMPVMEKAGKELEERGIAHEIRVMSAHRDPEVVADYAKNAHMRGLRVIIAGAGLAAALPGVVAAHTELPVIGVPLTSKTSVAGGLDAMLAIAQMPPGVPVACVGVDAAKNAAVLAAKILDDVIDRYTRPEMGAVWSEQRKLDTWLAVELAVTEALADAEVVPAEDAAEVRDRASFTVDAVKEREKVTDHDVAAFVDVVAESVGEAGRWVHHGLTSSDVLDTALAMQLSQAGMILAAGARDFRDALIRRAREHQDTLCVGRTHGVHAEPTTFGVKLAGFAFEADRNLHRIERGGGGHVGRGAVGGRGHLRRQRAGARGGRARPARPGARGGIHAGRGARPSRRAAVRHRLRRGRARALRHRDPAPPAHGGARGRGAVPGGAEGLLRDAAQAQPDRHRADHAASPGSCAATPRPASRTSRCGTSATSRTPRWSGWRCPTPPSCSTTRSTSRCGSWRAWSCTPGRMRKNLDLTHGALFSQRALLALVESGKSRDDAYRIVQENARHAWETGTPFRDLLGIAAPELDLDEVFDPQSFVRHSATIVGRLDRF